jgi:hypothetical protein
MSDQRALTNAAASISKTALPNTFEKETENTFQEETEKQGPYGTNNDADTCIESGVEIGYNDDNGYVTKKNMLMHFHVGTRKIDFSLTL